MALQLAHKVDADIVLATDPDADRLGVYAKDSTTGEYHLLTGNMSGMIICEYLLSQKKKKGTLASNGAIIKTIVTTDMADKAAQAYHIKLIETLTGFKYIGEQIKLFEQHHNYQYVFGFEESYGCLIGTYARDKDAVGAVMSLCEAAAYYKMQGKMLWDQMLEIFEKYGYYTEGLDAITLQGAEGKRKIQEIIAGLRRNPVKKIGNYQIDEFRDYKKKEIWNVRTGEHTISNLPESNVLYYKLDQGAWFCVRPSGTEPKIKFYYGVKGTGLEDAKEQLETLKKEVKQLVESIQ